MDEAEDNLAVVFSEQPVVLVQGLLIGAYLVDKGGFGVMVVVEVDLHVAETEKFNFGQQIEQLGPVFLLRVEECVLRRLPNRVGVALSDLGPALAPKPHAVQGHAVLAITPVRLVMISDRHPNPSGRSGVKHASEPAGHVAGQPDLRVFWQFHAVIRRLKPETRLRRVVIEHPDRVE